MRDRLYEQVKQARRWYVRQTFRSGLRSVFVSRSPQGKIFLFDYLCKRLWLTLSPDSGSIERLLRVTRTSMTSKNLLAIYNRAIKSYLNRRLSLAIKVATEFAEPYKRKLSGLFSSTSKIYET